MSPYLSNTDSDTTRAAINKTLAALLKAVKKEKAIMLLDNTLTWFSADSLPQNLLACKLLAVFIDALEVEFIKTKLKMIVSKLMEFLKSSDNVVIQVILMLFCESFLNTYLPHLSFNFFL